MLRAFEKLGSLRDAERFGAWFYAVLLSVHRNRSRRSFWSRFRSLEDLEARGVEPIDTTSAAWEHGRQQAARVSRALATLPALQRQALVLHELEGYSLQEVAAMQGVTVAAVKTRTSRARARLRRYYERLGFRPHRSRPEDAAANTRTEPDDSTAVELHERAI